MLSQQDIQDLKGRLTNGTKVVISTHKGPDGDAIGSSTALKEILIQLGCDVTIVVPDGFPDFIKWMKGATEIKQYDRAADRILHEIEAATVIFSLDYNDLKRVGEIGVAIEKSNAFKVLIDHHEEPQYVADVNCSVVTSCSTAQLIYEFAEEMDWLEYINQDVAASIYCGILTDTGSFRFPSVDAKTHEIAAALIKGGLKHHLVHEALFDGNTRDKLALNGYAVSEKLEVLPNGKVAVIGLSSEELIQFNAKKGDTEGLVNKALSIKGIQMAAFFRQQDGIVKISFRSKGDYFVNELARDNFSGGGHKYAAGGMSVKDVPEAINDFKQIVDAYL